ncbi:MAG: TlpA family protein disulfide reductase, partial [Planctomycetota bacterium]|jgi:peroxiredoxin
MFNVIPNRRLHDLRPEVIQRFDEAHFADPELSRVFYMLEGIPSDAAEHLLRKALEEHPDPEVRAHACYFLAEYLFHYSKTARRCREDPEVLESIAIIRGEPVAKKYRDADPDRFQAEAEGLYGRVAAEHSGVMKRSDTYSRLGPDDLKRLQRNTLAELAERALSALEQIAVGLVAPEIEGEDVDGVRFMVSDYSGKVVVLAFSALWCGPCRRMHAHERELVERLKDEPFALVHVSGDYSHSRDQVKEMMAQGEITWRSFWDGGPDGPIAAQWNIKSWPAVFVLDPHGVIRHRDVRGGALDRAVDALIEETKGDAERSS